MLQQLSQSRGLFLNTSSFGCLELSQSSRGGLKAVRGLLAEGIMYTGHSYQEAEPSRNPLLVSYRPLGSFASPAETCKESKLRRVLRRIILEFGESDAEVIRQSQNREKMIGIGMDMGTIGFDPNWDYATNRPLKPKKMHRLDPELQLVADMIKDDFEELQLMPGRNGGPPDMFYFTMVGSGIRARCDHDSYNVNKNYPDFTGDGCFVEAVGPDAVKFAFGEGAETSDPVDTRNLLEDFIDWASNNIQEDSIWMTFSPAE